MLAARIRIEVDVICFARICRKSDIDTPQLSDRDDGSSSSFEIASESSPSTTLARAARKVLRRMSSPRSLFEKACHVRSKSLPTIAKSSYSTFLRTATKPDYHSSSAAAVKNGCKSELSSPTTLVSPLGKTSFVQQMWFHGDQHINRVTKGMELPSLLLEVNYNMLVEQLSKNIAALTEDDPST